MNRDNQRLTFVAEARLIGILLVVLGHSYPFGVAIPGMMDALRGFVYTFHMPLFLFIGGCLSSRNTRSPGAYIGRRAGKLLIPYVGLSLLAYVPKLLVQQYLNDRVAFSLWYLLRSELVPRENVWGHFWYLPVIFFFGVFSAFAGDYLKRNPRSMMLVLAGSFCLLFLPRCTDWFALEDLRSTFFYYVLGMAVGNREDAGVGILRDSWVLALPAALGVFWLLPGSAHWLCAVAMTGFVLWVGTKLRLTELPLFKELEQYSYSVFLLSWPAQAVAEICLNKLLRLPVMVTMAGMLVCGIAGPLVCVFLIGTMEKHLPLKWARVLIGL